MNESFDLSPRNKSTEGNEGLDISVLLVDDNEFIIEISLPLLEDMGCNVDTAGDGQELLEKLRANPTKYGLIITDNNMPKKTGIEALRDIRGNEDFKNMPVVVNTGDSWMEEEITELGGVYLSKPYQFDEFKEAVRKALQGRKGV